MGLWDPFQLAEKMAEINMGDPISTYPTKSGMILQVPPVLLAGGAFCSRGVYLLTIGTVRTELLGDSAKFCSPVFVGALNETHFDPFCGESNLMLLNVW